MMRAKTKGEKEDDEKHESNLHQNEKLQSTKENFHTENDNDV